ncbi:TIGR04100 family radical SAM protein [Acetanaerobacterium elongatum]|uniref:Radical SAM enzyme, TIGR04100 family n=1 Tax=Acetanaerobacterium elongatum TaxID=258515 RepID=A0A1H0F7F3_9FIRM|nr:TIGR04100 family radical SAM protein [Acetanaerobacterium elongatum]SDN90469.1 radical SAM enzyme, TIGR04100 family [Acetanaerobacterium elongatum]
MTIFYKYGGKLYINVTNRCSCNCTFCIRQNGDTVGDSGSLWLEHEPSFEEIVKAFEAIDITGFTEVVFCGYGEPMERLDIVLQTCEYLRRVSKLKIRLNTNGLSDLINGKPTAHLLKGLVDTVSISLNASNAKEYESVCRPSFGENAFPAMLQFARDCMQSVERVIFSVVDIIPKQEIEACQKLADEMGIPLRVRVYEG